MRFTELICFAARRAFDESADLGVRLSPLRVDLNQLDELVEEVVGIEGYTVYLAISVSGATALERERVCIADGERAAERATEWRNSISPEAGDRIIYISSQRLGKAGGLEDTLYPINEEMLREAFLSWLESDATAAVFPEGFAEALKGTEIVQQVSARALTTFSQGVQELGDEADDWAKVGALLPILGLTRDTALTMDDAARRLNANHKLVRRASTREQRGWKPKTAEGREVVRQLTDTISQTEQDRTESLSEVDLGVLDTEELAPTVKRKARSTSTTERAARTKSAASGGDAKKARSTTKRRTPGQSDRAELLIAALGIGDAVAEDPDDLDGGAIGSSRVDVSLAGSMQARALDELLTSEVWQRDAVGVLRQVSAPTMPKTASASAAAPDAPTGGPEHSGAPPNTTPPVPPTPAAPEPPPRPSVWSAERQRAEFGRAFEPLPSGLSTMMERVLASEGGRGLVWTLKSSPLRDCLIGLPPKAADDTLERRALPEGVSEPVRVALDRWERRRAGITQVLLTRGQGHGAFERFIFSPLLSISEHPAFIDALSALLNDAAALMCAVAESQDQRLMREVLHLDTITLRGENVADELLVFSPLHPLILGQILARFEQLSNASELNANTRRLLVRALTQAPLAPQEWPGMVQTLKLSAPIFGLLVYEDNPNDASDDDAQQIGRALVEKYLELSPFARVGMEIVALGGSPRALIEGFAEAIVDDEHQARLTVLLGCHADGALSEQVQELVEAGRLVLKPAPCDLERRNPHMIVQLNPRREREDWEYSPDVAPQYSTASGQGRTSFSISDQGLLTTTMVRGLRGVEEVEQLHSLLSGRSPNGRFVHAEDALRLRAVFPEPASQPTTWQVTIGARISKTPRPGSNLLLFEEVGEAGKVAVLTESVVSATRDLQPTFELIGVQDVRPTSLEMLARQLAQYGHQGLLSLRRSNKQLVAASTLALQLRALRGMRAGVSAPITGASASTLLGLSDDGIPGAFALAVWRDAMDELGFCVGYAALDEALELDTSASRPTGELVDRMRRLGELIGLAAQREDSLGPNTAREALRWLLMPAIAEARATDLHNLAFADLGDMLNQLGDSVRARVEGVCLLPARHPGVGLQRATIGGAEVVFHALDERRFEELRFEVQSLG